MHKVGIITFHCADNFGAVLQAYSLQENVRQLGNFEVEIINFRPNRIVSNYTLFLDVFETLKERSIRGTVKELILRILNSKVNYKRIKNFSEFRKNYLRLSERTYNLSKDLYNDKPKYDYYIAGSDQVWNPKFFCRIGNAYFLEFAREHSKRISYAASIAVEVNNKYYKVFEENLKNFDYISVRENSAKNFIEQFTDKKIYVTVDPTLLNTKEQWDRVATFNFMKDIQGKYILVYDLVKDSNIVNLANAVASRYGGKIISYSNKRGFYNWHSSFSSCSPTDFVGLYKNADFIITSSFHGTVFSLIYNKPFFTVPHPTRGSRMTELLEDVDLIERVFNNNDNLQNINKEINYYKVNKRLAELREKSLSYLKDALGCR